LHGNPGVLAIRIGHQQLEALVRWLAIHRDIGNAGSEGAADAGDLLEYAVGNAMRTIADGSLGHRHRLIAQQGLACQHVDQIEAQRHVAIASCRDTTDHHVVDPGGPPTGGIDLRGP
jgi:hypothetical protein